MKINKKIKQSINENFLECHKGIMLKLNYSDHKLSKYFSKTCSFDRAGYFEANLTQKVN